MLIGKADGGRWKVEGGWRKADKVRAAFEKCGLSMAELGRRMGYVGDTAEKSVWQFLNRTSDPRISMLRKFADAVGVKLSKLVGD